MYFGLLSNGPQLPQKHISVLCFRKRGLYRCNEGSRGGGDILYYLNAIINVFMRERQRNILHTEARACSHTGEGGVKIEQGVI